MSFKAFVYIYIFGGITFIPLVLVLILLYAHYTLPYHVEPATTQPSDSDYLVKEGDEKVVLKSGTDDLAEKFHRKHESDVAAGYFAVCREYVPGGVNGKPPDKLSPAGEVVATESPSVYQTMYRSIFDRVQKPSIEPNKESTGRSVKRTNNVFYVVLRHGHLMLYDDIQQLEVRYVISLEYHDVDVYGGGDVIPEAELWIKRNAIRLSRKKIQVGDKAKSMPFFLFSENQSEKEDFYFALLNNMQKNLGDDPPQPQEFETADIITLVQKLHSSEEQLQTRWLNALLGRLFLAVYKTPELEAHLRQKLTKKISRVKKPDFITKLALQNIDMGNSAPFFTNPRLKDLTVNGDCTVETDVEYTGGLRIQIAATVRIDLGTRLKAREVDIVLAASCKRLQGHMLTRIKPPPSNRLWMTFEKVPKIELKLEPIVSSRQITYGIILRAIESRIMEVVAETIVLPFWDDLPFMPTEKETFRGGIWRKDAQPTVTTEIKDEVAEDEAEAGTGASTPSLMGKDERVMSMPVLTDGNFAATAAARKSVISLKDDTPNHSDGAKTPDRASRQAPPRMLRSTSFASAADPMVSPNHAPAESAAMDIKATSKRDSMLKDLSSKSLGTSPEADPQTPTREPAENIMEDANRNHSIASFQSSNKASRRSTTESENAFGGSIMSGRTNESLESKRSSTHSDSKPSIAAAARNFANADHQTKLASIAAARDAAQKWGWGVLARNKNKDGDDMGYTNDNHTIDTSQPMGRGQPLPPPGQPLPRPAKPSIFAGQKRRPTQPSTSAKEDPSMQYDSTASESPPKHKVPPPPLPDRKRRQSLKQQADEQQDDELLVVEAPRESAPTSPLPAEDEHHDDFFGHGEIQDPTKAIPPSLPPKYAPPLPKRSEAGDSGSVKMDSRAPPLPKRAKPEESMPPNTDNTGEV